MLFAICHHSMYIQFFLNEDLHVLQYNNPNCMSKNLNHIVLNIYYILFLTKLWYRLKMLSLLYLAAIKLLHDFTLVTVTGTNGGKISYENS